MKMILVEVKEKRVVRKREGLTTSYVFAILFLCITLQSYSQKKHIPKDSTYTDKKYIAWISPSSATHIYGCMFNFWPRNDGFKFERYPTIYGVEFNLMPLGIFFPILLAVHSLDPSIHEKPFDNTDTLPFKSFKQIHGLQLGFVNMEPSVINGLDINATGSNDSKTNGITLSLVLNRHYIMNGISIAALGNHDAVCNGVQIGLVNTCGRLKGFQFGLWNKNQKRSFPIMNWCFKKG